MRAGYAGLMPEAPFIPVIPAGGSGTRLWPLSRRDRPKFLLDLTGEGRSLLQLTLDRLAPLADRPPIVVTGRAHAAAGREQLGDHEASGAVRVRAEPSARNSMPAIALAAARGEREEPDAVIGSFAADHLIEDEAAFARAVTAARDAAELGLLVTLGITPTCPSTAFGYIQAAGASADDAPADDAPADDAPADAALAGRLRAVGAEPVARFVEKPDRERAEEFIAAGMRWYAGMFVVRANVLLDERAAQIHALAAGAREIAAAHGTDEAQQVLERVWPTMTAIAIDHALAEPLAAQGRVAMVPAEFGWDDVGDFAALARLLRDREGRVLRGEDGTEVHVVGSASVDAHASRATVYGATDRHIALLGLQGVSIVDTEDALLVLADEQAQALQHLVDRLDAQGLDRLR